MTGEPVVVAGVGMTVFTRHGRSVRDTAQEAVSAALLDAGLHAGQVQFVAFANAVGGLITGQEMIRAQSALRHTGLLGASMLTVENACASGAAALQLAAMAISAGRADVAVAVGAERLTSTDRTVTFAAIGTALDLAEFQSAESDVEAASRSPFMEVYGTLAIDYMERTGARAEDFAQVVVKNRRHASANPHAQLRDPVTLDEVLGARTVWGPLTVPMCSPIGDGAAAVVLISERARRRLGVSRQATLRSTAMLSSGPELGQGTAVERAAVRAFEEASIAPADVELAEVHDGAAPGELLALEQLGLCEPGGALGWLRDGVTTLGGRVPVNPSGGLLSRGHPIGATGIAQIVELTLQLAGRAGHRQAERARVAVAENAGGWIAGDSAAGAVTVLTS
jgi:acetyl-CoA acetyltransferase